MVIDQSLRPPLDYCREPEQPDHSTCVHATLHYDEAFHEDDRVRKLEYSDSFSIPLPEISYGIWKELNSRIENRTQDQEAKFFVQWGMSKYNVMEVNTIRVLAKEFQRLKGEVAEEKHFLENGKNHPVPLGIVNLDEADDDILSVTQKVLYNNLHLKENTPLSTIERTMADYTVLDHEQLFNFSHFNRQFTEDELHCVLEVLNNQEGGKDVFLVYTPELKDETICEEYALNKGVHSAEVIHVIVNINLSKRRVNLTEKNGHWAYCAIPNDRDIIYGDPLGKSPPTNLMEVLNPVYRAKYRKDIVKNRVKINNISKNANFPLQTCSTICGLVSAMICISSFSSDFYQEIIFGKKENKQLEFVKNPSTYCEQIRMRFIKVVNSKKHCVEFFYPPQIQFACKQVNLERKTKMSAPNVWQSLISKTRTTSISRRKADVSASSNISNDASSRPPIGEPSTCSSSVSDVSGSSPIHSKGQSSVGTPRASTPEPHCTTAGEEVEHHNVNNFVKSNFIGLRSFKSGLGFPDNDGHRWTFFCGKKKSKGPQKYKCLYEECTALKHLFKTKVELKKKRLRGDKKYPINVNYIAQHSCTDKPKGENILLSSYWTNMKGKKIEESTPELVEGHEIDTNEDENIATEPVSNEANSADSPVSLTEQHFAEVAEGEHGINLIDVGHGDKSSEEEHDDNKKSKDLSFSDEIAGWTEFDFSNTEELSFTNSTNQVEESHVEMDKEHGDNTAEEQNNVPETEQDSNDNSFGNEIDTSAIVELPVTEEPSNVNSTNRVAEECLQTEQTQMDKSVSRSKESFPCYVCSFVLTSLEEFLEHTTTSHGKVCIVCSYGTTTDELLEEHKVEKSHFKCPQCDYKINCVDLLKKHREDKHGHIDHSDTVNDVPGSTLKRIDIEDTQSDKIKEKMRISPTIREASSIDISTPDDLHDNCLANELDTNNSNSSSGSAMDTGELRNFQGTITPDKNDDRNNGSDDEMTTSIESQTDDDIEDEGPIVRTKLIENLKVDTDENEGNIAFIINNVQSEKKPKTERNKFNWGNSQSQRGKTTFYQCSGYFNCEKCQIKAKQMANCTTCETPLTHKKCAAKKYVYFCKSNCVREAFKDCCEIEPARTKLVLLYIDEHSCAPVNLIEDVSSNSKFKEVKTKEDILENIKTHVENGDEHFSIENVDRVPNDVDGNSYYLLENPKNLDLKDLIRDGRKWKTYVQTSNRTFSNILGESNSKKIRKYSCSNQYFCFNEECPFKKRFELVNQVLICVITFIHKIFCSAWSKHIFKTSPTNNL